MHRVQNRGIKSASKAIQQIGKIMTSIVQSVAANPVVWIILLVVLLMAVIVGAIGAVIGSGGAANSAEDYTYQAQVSEQTEEDIFGYVLDNRENPDFSEPVT